jgi:hypothetical protein
MGADGEAEKNRLLTETNLASNPAADKSQVTAGTALLPGCKERLHQLLREIRKN